MLKLVLIVLVIAFIIYCYLIVRNVNKDYVTMIVCTSIVLLIMRILPSVLCSIYSVSSNDSKVMQDYILNVVSHSNGSIEFNEVEQLDTFIALDYITQYVLSNPDLQLDVSIKSEDELNKFIEDLEFDEECSDYVKCYLKYTSYCLAEYSLDEEADDYWHLKYISHDKALSYNYGILVKYKEQGFLIKYQSLIDTVDSFMFMFLVIFWLIVSFLTSITQTGGNKSDL